MFGRVIIITFIFTVSMVDMKAQFFSYPKDNPVELGKVNWLRSYDLALKKSKEVKRPILILFQEVPGCNNCTKFGNEILSHPLIVEGIESFFIPLCIYNNKGGLDKEVLGKYEEPAWNNPVIRVVDQTGKDIIDRQPDFRSQVKTLNTIINALKKSGQEIPGYLKILLDESAAVENRTAEEAYLSMYCFWSGEKEIGGMPGIISTEAGYMHGKEVVKVNYDREITSLSTIVEKASKASCADQVFASVQKDINVSVQPIGKYRKDREDKYYLSKSEFMIIPMTELQKTKVNRAIALGQSPDQYLSPGNYHY
ncbi:MAG: peptide-methionine (S)-S-oxide reductase [Saprospiraceae bacterium]|nr:peptide-methionine (S)-S-oxide reductase [Saprospiraceae bacterium]